MFKAITTAWKASYRAAESGASFRECVDVGNMSAKLEDGKFPSRAPKFWNKMEEEEAV